MTRRLITICAVAVTFIANVEAQEARTLIEQDITRIGCTLHTYEVPKFHDTKAPKGYKPFYVSHFGRHGSRYHGSEEKYASARLLDSLGSLGLLSEEGMALSLQLDSLIDIHRGMYGFLTQVGSREHQGVASRLYDRCPEIFRQKDRTEVTAVSSTVVRCIQSMANFCTSLKGRAPDLQISYYTNQRTDETLTRVRKGRSVLPGEETGKEVLDSLKHAIMDVERMMNAFFVDKQRTRALIGDEKLFFYDIINCGIIEQCLDEKAPKVYSHFTTDELYNYWLCNNAYALNQHGFCFENKMTGSRKGQYILRDVLAKADEALTPGSRKAADFRFSHDGQTLPLIFFLGIDGCDKIYHMYDGARNGWYAFQKICMCSNLQIIFYRNKKGDVLVKFLHNEQERRLRDIEPVYGPYYKWSELRPYLDSLCHLDLERVKKKG